ncbi:MAG: hypothetical protein WCJ02_15680 [bacterium]
MSQNILQSFIVSALLCPLAMSLHAWEPNDRELDAAIQRGDFADYLSKVTPWLNQKVPANPDEKALVALLKDLAFRTVLNQRQLIVKTGADKLGVFAKADPANKAFLSWLLKDTQAMDLYLEGSVPIGLATRDSDKYTLNTAALEIWKKILGSDQDAKAGIYQKMAIATAILPPGSVNIGAGGAKTPADPVVRYTYYKTAHKNGELFPSFDHLTVWEYSTIMCSGASDADLTWGRKMANTMRPDMRVDEMVVNTTSHVWRRGAPEPFWIQEGGYNGSFKNVLAGGGKCGPRSSWSVFICHAFGIPAIGVGQPAHACVAYKAANPMTEPQPGSAWKVGFGGGWDKSTLEATKGEKLKGPDFLKGIEKRADATKFSHVEHLRWFANALAAADKVAAVMGVARTINDSIKGVKTDLTASLKAEEAEADPGAVEKSRFGKSKPVKLGSAAAGAPVKTEASVKVAPGVIHVEAASFAKTGGRISWGGQFPNVLIHNSYPDGGKQVYFQQQMNEQWADYSVNVPVAGTYLIAMKAACINTDQLLEVCAGTNVIAKVDIPLSFGLWTETKPVELKLAKGMQTLRVQTPVSVKNAENHKRSIALKSFELIPKK